VKRAWTTAAAVARAHPRHLLLGALVVGMLLSEPVAHDRPLLIALALAVAAALTALLERPPLAVTAAAVLFAGALAAEARLHALDRTALTPLIGRGLSARATLLEQPRRSPSGSRAALVRLRDGPGRGERLLLRMGRRVRWAGAATGTELALGGRLARLGRYDAYQRRRGAHAVLIARDVRPTDRARAGAAGALDRARSRVERGLTAGLPQPLAALARGMVLGEDEQLSQTAREEFRRSGLAHLLSASE
jgi:competence protein ComEC